MSAADALDLDREAYLFADELSSLLNNTVCKGVRLSSVVTHPGRAMVAYRITATDQTIRQGIPLTLGPKDPSGYLGLFIRLGSDKRNRHLMVESSSFGFYLDPQQRALLARYDYERDKGDGYPEAHLQINGSAPVWDEVCRREESSRPLEHLHFPVGGRRYRPTVEDLIEFLVVEGIAEGRSGWQERVAQGREGFRLKQLGAAIGNETDYAAEELRSHGYTITAPDR